MPAPAQLGINDLSKVTANRSALSDSSDNQDSQTYPSHWHVAYFFTGFYHPPMAGQVFQHHHRVTYAECTVGNHVYYARYLDLLEAARGEMFRNLGVPFQKLQDAGVIFPAVECQLRYKGPARYDEVLRIAVWVTDLRSVRVTFRYRVMNESERLILEASTTHACTDLHDKPTRIPADLAEKLNAYLPADADDA